MAKTKTSTVTPLGDRVLVKRVQADDKTKGGIILPDTAKEKPREGVVMAVGLGKLLDGGKRQSLSVKKKDRVLFSSYAGSEASKRYITDELLPQACRQMWLQHGVPRDCRVLLAGA